MIEQTIPHTHTAGPLTLTIAATTKVRELLQQEPDSAVGLRVFVAGGGCSGMQYGMTLDKEQEGDTLIVQNDVTIFVDEMSLDYLIGSEVDYVDSLMGAGFVVNNPNAVSTCGCGHSFKTAQGGSAAQSGGCSH